jgi:hypothetical protein
MAASGAPALVAALRGGGAAAARAVRECKALSITSSGRAELSRCGAVAATVGLLGRSTSSDAVVLRPACQLLALLCSQCPPNAAAAVAAGCMPALARVCDGEDPLLALEAYAALLAVFLAEGPLVAATHSEAAAAAGVADAAARLVARPRGGAGDICLGEALSVLTFVTGSNEPAAERAAERAAASGALSGAIPLLLSPDEYLSRSALMLVVRTTELSAAAARAVALDPAAAPALIEVLMAAPDVDGAFANAPCFAASVLGRMAQKTMGRASTDAAPNAVMSDVRRAGGVPRMVELLRAVLDGGALPEGYRFACRMMIVQALSAVVVLDVEARPAALAAGAAPLLARVVSGVSAGPRGLDGDVRELNALDALAVLGDVPRVGRAALAAQPGLAATVALILNAGLVGWLRPTTPNGRDSVLGGAAALLGALLKCGDALGTAAASEVAAAGGALSLVRFECACLALRAAARPPLVDV